MSEFDDIYEQREEIRQKIRDNEFQEEYYAAGTTAFHDEESDLWYNQSGQQLRSPKEYDRHSEGYTPFGDEGDDY